LSAAHERRGIPSGMTAPAVDRERRPTVAVFDLDCTITRRATFTPFVVSVARRSPRKFAHAIPIILAAALCAMGFLPRARLKELMLSAVLGGASAALVQEHVDRFVDACLEAGLRPGALEAIERHRQHGDRLLLATASFDLYACTLGQRLGFDTVVATLAQWDDQDRLSGRIAGDNCRGEAKLRAVERALPGANERFRVVAYSDELADLPLLKWADTAIAVNPSGRLRRYARAAGWPVVDWNRESGSMPAARGEEEHRPS
jgi:HAD superfamily hydrolase (TIGR01490 family)